MKTLVIAAQKGGAGKTTLAVHLAAAAIAQGMRVGLVDTDPQGSASAWASNRSDQNLAVVPLAPHALDEGIAAAEADGYDLLVVDTPPHAAAGTAAALAHADLALIPVRPSVLDLATLPQSLALLHASGRPGALVVSAAPVTSGETKEMQGTLAGFGLPVLTTVIYNRTPYYRALAHGKAVSEYEPRGKAAIEIRALWLEVLTMLNQGDSK